MFKRTPFVIYSNRVLSKSQVSFVTYLRFHHSTYHKNEESCYHNCSWKYCKEHRYNME